MQGTMLERLEAGEVIARYADSLNHRDWDRYRDCWTEDCTFQQTIGLEGNTPTETVTTFTMPASLKATGRDNVVHLVSAYNLYKWSFQLPTNVFVELDGPAHARIRHVLLVRTDILTYLGICYDSAVREADGVWRLRHRDYRPSYFESATAPGVLCRVLPEAGYRNLPELAPEHRSDRAQIADAVRG